MAISGSGDWIPAVRVSLHDRQLRLDQIAHNVPRDVLWTPEQAAARFIDCPNAYIYVPTMRWGGVGYLYELLKELDLVD